MKETFIFVKASVKLKTVFTDFQPLTIFGKSSILDVWQGSEYASAFLNIS